MVLLKPSVWQWRIGYPSWYCTQKTPTERPACVHVGQSDPCPKVSRESALPAWEKLAFSVLVDRIFSSESSRG